MKCQKRKTSSPVHSFTLSPIIQSHEFSTPLTYTKTPKICKVPNIFDATPISNHVNLASMATLNQNQARSPFVPTQQNNPTLIQAMPSTAPTHATPSAPFPPSFLQNQLVQIANLPINPNESFISLQNEIFAESLGKVKCIGCGGSYVRKGGIKRHQNSCKQFQDIQKLRQEHLAENKSKLF